MFIFEHLPEHYSLQQASLEITVIIFGATILGFLLGYSFALVKGYIYWFRQRFSTNADNQEAVADLNALREKAAKQNGALKFDNFQRLLGIDAHIQQRLYHYGIRTYKDLEKTPTSLLKAILEEAGAHYSKLNPSTWSIQAKISAMGNWEQLSYFQYKIMNR